MIRAFLRWLTARLPVKVIGRPGQPYVEWYYVGTLPLFGGVRVQIHRFVGSDPDGLHDHPWGWSRSFVLTNWYREERRDGTRVRRAGQTYGMTGDTFHRVILDEGVDEVFTLFLHGPYVKHWGFITPLPTLDANRLRSYVPTWSASWGGEWLYKARPRSAKRFDDWHRTAPKGREIRRAA